MARTVEDRLTLACLKLLFKEREEVMKEIGALVGMGVNEHAFLHDEVAVEVRPQPRDLAGVQPVVPAQ